MKTWATVALAGLLAAAPALAGETLLDRDYRQLAGKNTVNLQDTYGGQVLLVVNTASKCGFTPQYEGLEAMHAKYKAQGFAVLGFPSNDFMGQEPGSEEEIQEFCTLTYGVKFPMFEKVQVRGDSPTPLYADMIKATGEAPGWNFHKYLIDRSGKVIASFGSRTTPDDPKLVAAIEKALAAPMPAKPAAKKD
ncbi:MAG: glutathione peroxidase [Arenimonas sp.]|nr:glutathione peroxidase [Arenimonas sp.]